VKVGAKTSLKHHTEVARERSRLRPKPQIRDFTKEKSLVREPQIRRTGG